METGFKLTLLSITVIRAMCAKHPQPNTTFGCTRHVKDSLQRVEYVTQVTKTIWSFQVHSFKTISPD